VSYFISLPFPQIHLVFSHPDIFYAGYASSAVVEAIEDYWGYFEPIRRYMPQNCSADVEKVIGYVDMTFTSGSKVMHLHGLYRTIFECTTGSEGCPQGQVWHAKCHSL
jgi:hypothetical protein